MPKQNGADNVREMLTSISQFIGEPVAGDATPAMKAWNASLPHALHVQHKKGAQLPAMFSIVTSTCLGGLSAAWQGLMLRFAYDRVAQGLPRVTCHFRNRNSTGVRHIIISAAIPVLEAFALVLSMESFEERAKLATMTRGKNLRYFNFEYMQELHRRSQGILNSVCPHTGIEVFDPSSLSPEQRQAYLDVQKMAVESLNGKGVDAHQWTDAMANLAA
jgi:hypothetical protein